MMRKGILFASLGLALTLVGCGGGTPKPQQIEVKATNDPLFQARSVLERYASGQPLSSEVSMFPQMVEEVRKSDAARADVLEKGLADIQKATPAARAAKAKELLAKLQSSMK